MLDDSPDPRSPGMIALLASRGYVVRLERHGEMWWAVCEHGGHCWYAKRAEAMNAIAAVVKAMGMAVA